MKGNRIARALLMGTIAGTLLIVSAFALLDYRASNTWVHFALNVEPIDDATAGRLIARWRSQGGREVTDEEFWFYKSSTSLIVPVSADERGVDLLYISELGPDRPLIYYEERYGLTLKQRLNYQSFSWTYDQGSLHIIAYGLDGNKQFLSILALTAISVVCGYIGGEVFFAITVAPKKPQEEQSDKS